MAKLSLVKLLMAKIKYIILIMDTINMIKLS